MLVALALLGCREPVEPSSTWEDTAGPLCAERAWFRDADGDGFGDPSFAAAATCSPPDGFVADSTDCDDTAPTAHPGGVEICDGEDDDCDGLFDEDIGPIWYVDADGDGFGDEAMTLQQCSQPAGYVINRSDCDDANADVHPDAYDVCNDALDSNCDGADSMECRRNGALSIQEAGYTLLGVHSGDEAGWSVSSAGDQDGDGADEMIVGARLAYRNGWDAPGAAYVLGMPAVRISTVDEASSAHIADTTLSQVGYAVQAAGDVDGDARPDILIATSNTTYLLHGPLAGDLSISDAAASIKTGMITLGAPGDLDGDGYAEILQSDRFAGDHGEAYIYNGPVAGNLDATGAALTLVGVATPSTKGTGSDMAGYSTAGGAEYDGDAAPDVLIGAPANSAGGWLAGAVYVVDANHLSGRVSLSDAHARLTGVHDDERSGRDVASPGDVNGDGYADVLVGSESAPAGYGQRVEDQWVNASLVLGPIPAGDFDLANAEARFHVEELMDGAWTQVAAPGDMDQDGFADLAIGASGAKNPDGYGTGAVYLLYGPVSGQVELVDADAKLYNDEPYTATGASLDAAGDVNGDGFPDLIVGAYDYQGTGAAFLLLGG